jgi:sugar phosphate isomerase/epimerase
MHTSRRSFIKKGSLAIAGATLFSNDMFAAYKTKQLTGIQLYSVRDDMKKDPLGTLKQLSAMGYKHVEHADYVNRKFYGHSASEFRKVLDDLGLKMPSGHTVLTKAHWDNSRNDFTDAWKFTVEDAATTGQQFVISPWLDESLRKNSSDLKHFMDVFNKSGELCKKHGMRFGYHNHDFEFSQKLDGITLYDLMMQETDPSLVIHQLDIGNLYNGGANAMEILKKHANRFVSMHVKDEIKATSGNEPYQSTILGAGIVGVKEVIDFAKKNATKHFIIEQESYQGKSPLECAKEDLQIMNKWGFKS